ncbi:beta-lactamase class A [Hydrogenophaga palleronii]|uniref:beta-lactamase n=1 Tax=Hydrogenophaga palleronii TaxID=65655 RepID=A0ABU1WJD0_9BURK|nr:serine hydrolase [Hydrogenophaga palleronii]MDR7149397.1 beta-lactamase class A [Hydrogenophaga palleronii]
MRQRIERIDKATQGQLGVYVKRLDNGETLAYQADRPWYLASSAKVPIAIAVLQDAEAGRFRLDHKIALQDGDKVDGSGNVVWQKSGTTYTVDALLRRMLMESDNTAANMLIRTIGEDRLNHRARSYLGMEAFNRITTFTQVRREVYGELHPDAHQFSNMELLRLASVPMGARRVAAFARALSVDTSELQAKTMQEAYARYYARRLNAASLSAYGGMLEQLVTGKLLSPQNLQRLFGDLKYETYDAYRLEAGLPRTVRFIHKTGTQFERACHMGVINPQDGARAAIIVAACAEDLNEHREARRAFEQIGRAITQTLLREPAAR